MSDCSNEDVAADRSLSIVNTDLSLPEHQGAVLELMEEYVSEPIISGRPLPQATRNALIDQLRQQENGRYFLALLGDDVVGMAICFTGFSTFRASRLLNVHDLAVSPRARGRGVGQALLAAVEEAAAAEGCCRLTLEVHANNRARNLYTRCGFRCGSDSSPVLFMSKALD